VAALCFLVAWFMWRSIWLRYRHRHPRSSPARCIRQAAAAVDYVPGTRSAETSPTPIFSTLLALPVPERKHCELPGWVEHGDLGNRSALPCHTSKSATHPRFVVTNTCPCLLPLSEFRRSDRVNRACEAEASSHARMRPSRTDPVNPVPVLSAVVSTPLISVSSWSAIDSASFSAPPTTRTCGLSTATTVWRRGTKCGSAALQPMAAWANASCGPAQCSLRVTNRTRRPSS
jgi:hypothetical protein